MKFALSFLLIATIAVAAPVATGFPSPTPADSQSPNLTAAPDGSVFLTYSAPSLTTGERALWLARLAPAATAWDTPRPIVSSPLLMENTADFASLCVGTDGALTAQWFLKIPGSTARHGYSGWFARSTDHGGTWSQPAPLGEEFVVLAPLSGGRTLAVWLARVHAHAAPHTSHAPAAPRPARAAGEPSPPAMKLLARLLAPDGASLGEWTVDPDVCTCCQNTVAVLPDDRVFVGYRGHNADEVRDNKSSLFNLAARTWSPPVTLRDDGWKIAACPVNGPAAAAHGDNLAVAWFTTAQGEPRVYGRRTDIAGKALAAPVRLDLGRPMGRLATVMLRDSTALFLWMEAGNAENAAGIYARRQFPDGALSAAHLVADSTQTRTSGWPRAAARANGRVVIAFTQAGPPNQVRTLELNPERLEFAATKTVDVSAPFKTSGNDRDFCIAPIGVSPQSSSQ